MVVVNNEFSDWASVFSCIIQGNVRGPTLFTIFINDIPIDITSNVNIFADDTKLYNSSSFVSSNRILPFVYTFSGIFVELLKVIQSAGMC